MTKGLFIYSDQSCSLYHKYYTDQWYASDWPVVREWNKRPLTGQPSGVGKHWAPGASTASEILCAAMGWRVMCLAFQWRHHVVRSGVDLSHFAGVGLAIAKRSALRLHRLVKHRDFIVFTFLLVGDMNIPCVITHSVNDIIGNTTDTADTVTTVTPTLTCAP